MHENMTSEAGSIQRNSWKEVIHAQQPFFSINLRELWEYRDLLFILVRRDFLALYKQTILGPLWFFIHPAIATIVYVMVFSRAAGMSTGTLPPAVFYLSGLVLWGFFSECVLRTASTFKDSAALLSKVYFPRLVIPFSIVITNLIKLSIQLVLLVCVLLFFIFVNRSSAIHTGVGLWWIIPCIILIGLLGLGVGLLVASVTTKYKDLSHLITFLVQMMMFASPVILDMSKPMPGMLQYFVRLNPVSGIIDAFRYAVTGQGTLDFPLIAYDAACAVVLLAAGMFAFNKVQRNFVDVI